MSYSDYQAFDFLNDEYFVLWVKNPTAESDRFWVKWKEKHPEKNEAIQLAKKIIISTRFDELHLEEEEKDEVLASLLSKLDQPNSKFSKSVHLSNKRNTSVTWRNIAAGLILLIVSVFIFYTYQDKEEEGKVALEKVDAQIVIKHNPAGVKSKIKLSDGTLVFLNSKSEISFPRVFTGSKREVNLKGEAYFVVKENEETPFIVTSYNLLTEALGTSFNIKTKQNGENVEVSLIEGKVKIENSLSDATLILNPDEQVEWFKSQDQFNKKAFNKDEVLAWTENTLVFIDADFDEVISTLSDWYGVEFIIKRKPDLFKKYNASFKDKSLEQVLENMQFTSGIIFEIKNSKVFIK